MGQKLLDILNLGLLGILATAEKENDALATFYIVLGAALALAAGYLLGSFNPAIFFSKKLYGKDIREEGSGNAGMTNMLRTHGKKAGVKTALGDLGKTVIACIIGYLLLGYDGCALAGFATVIGHIAPVFYGFKGGKGVMVAAGTLLCLDPLIFLLTMIFFAFVLYISKTVSIASIMSALVFPFMFNRIGGHYGIPMVTTILTMCVIIYKHRSNLKRILEGTEPKTTIGGKKTEKASASDSDAPDAESIGDEEIERQGKPDKNTSKKKAKRRK